MIKYIFQKDAPGFSILSLLLKIAWEGKAQLVLGWCEYMEKNKHIEMHLDHFLPTTFP